MYNLKLIKQEQDEDRIISFFEGYGYEIKTIHIIGDITSRTMFIRPIKYKSSFHFNFNLSFSLNYYYEIESDSLASPISYDQIDETIEGFQIAKKLFEEIKLRQEELFPNKIKEQ